MSETILKAMERTEDLRVVRAAGFIPGVLNGPGTKSTSVKFESRALNKVIANHGKNAKVWVESGAEKQFGFIKDIQRHPVEGNILHTVIHLVSADQEVKMLLPIVYHGAA
jgi:large subunit ribosomal protein L25